MTTLKPRDKLKPFVQDNRSIGSGYVYGHTKCPNSIQHAQIHNIKCMVRDSDIIWVGQLWGYGKTKERVRLYYVIKTLLRMRHLVRS